MITIIRDRVRDLVNAGRSLEQVKAAAPAKGYAGRYGNDGGDWTTDRFVEAVYRSLDEGEAVRRSLVAIAALVLARRGVACARSRSRATAGQCVVGVGPRHGADRSDRLLGVVRHRELALPHGDACQR